MYVTEIYPTASPPQVHPPNITMRDFEKVLTRARPTVGAKDLEVYENFTKEFGEEG
jgi:vacuolar protein-sorting-associated protein 4